MNATDAHEVPAQNPSNTTVEIGGANSPIGNLSASEPSADGSVADPATAATATAVSRRIIKRYSNRKLYDTCKSRYVTLLQIADMVRAGEDVQIIDNASKEDKTDVTLALIISEELKAKPRAIPLSTLRALIRNRGERLLSQLRDSPIGRLMPADSTQATVCAAPSGPRSSPDAMVSETSGAAHGCSSSDFVSAGARPSDRTPSELAPSDSAPGAIRRTLDQWQHSVDDRLRGILPQFSNVGDLQREIARLTARVSTLEQLLKEASAPASGPSAGSPSGE